MAYLTFDKECFKGGEFNKVLKLIIMKVFFDQRGEIC